MTRMKKTNARSGSTTPSPVAETLGVPLTAMLSGEGPAGIRRRELRQESDRLKARVRAAEHEWTLARNAVAVVDYPRLLVNSFEQLGHVDRNRRAVT